MKVILTIWGLGILYCVYDAVFNTQWDPKSKEYLDNRENKKK